MTQYPGKDAVYIPALSVLSKPPDHTIEEVRERGQILAVSEDGTRATVCIKDGLMVSFCAVLLDKEGKITEFMPRAVNRYTKVTPLKNKLPLGIRRGFTGNQGEQE